ncbi:hypothetical protein L3X38_044739 [Prunus dulcis]|uniref:Uncharacterized protein n=1 Tax=Prunus dulcis TaxID=3755 RepID=A0AAD4YP66_PRUDU|nr:hypothetical protein L3X38_044739 [Prunus dulcis]
MAGGSRTSLRKNWIFSDSEEYGSALGMQMFWISRHANSNFLKVVQTVWKVGRDGIEAGTNLVPDSVPRSIARVSVTVVALALSLFVLKFSLCGLQWDLFAFHL